MSLTSADHPLQLLRLGGRTLALDEAHGVLEVFSGGTSQARILLLGASAALDGPDRKDRHELRITGAGGSLLFSERVDGDAAPVAAVFAERVHAAAERTTASFG